MKVRTCSECSTEMVSCDKAGSPDPDGGYLVCPMAREEQTKDEFTRPYRKRLHTQARIEEKAKTARARLAAKRSEALFMFDADAGKRFWSGEK